MNKSTKKIAKRIALIACSKSKADSKSKAENLYRSNLFKLSLTYAKKLQIDRIYILSAKYGLLDMDAVIEPYDLCLWNKNKAERVIWSEKVIEQLKEVTNINEDHFYIFAGVPYREGLLSSLQNYTIPLEGLTQGQQMQYLKQQLNKLEEKHDQDKVYRLHELFNKAKRYYNDYNIDELIDNGIYILFEKGEKYGHMDRVVRVGSHTGINKLPARIDQHYKIQTKDRSIFRKNIGRVYLNVENDPYLEVWNRCNISKKDRIYNMEFRDLDKEIQLEDKITKKINDDFSFVLIKAEDKAYRLYLETAIATTLAQGSLKPSPTWFGNDSPKEKIRKVGLWQVQNLNRDCVNEFDIEYIQNNIIMDKIGRAHV